MRPPVVPIHVSADPAPFTILVRDRRRLAKHELGHLRRWRDSSPVRVGNAAWRQRQLDVPGEVLGSALILRDQIGDMDGAPDEEPHASAYQGALEGEVSIVTFDEPF